jgi:hypothetical protein
MKNKTTKITLSNCWISCVIFWIKNRNNAKLIFEPTKREYWWVKMPHCYIIIEDMKYEFLPIKDNLGKFPMPLFLGHWKITKF